MSEKELIYFIKMGLEYSTESARFAGVPVNEEAVDQARQWLDQKYEEAE